MKRINIKNKKVSMVLFSLVLVCTLVVPKSVHASAVGASYNFFKSLTTVYFDLHRSDPELWIGKTFKSLLPVIILDGPITMFTGLSGDDWSMCSIYSLYNRALTTLDASGAGGSAIEELAKDRVAEMMARKTGSTAAEMRPMVDDTLTEVDGTMCNLNSTSPTAYSHGSALALAANIRDDVVLADEVVPVNLAYFFKDYAKKVPLVKNTAFAADEPEYSAVFGVGVIHDLWKVVRNIAYGILAVSLLVIGIMIMTRKKLSSQVAVTVQLAIPRIVIAVILIFLSYPIGAWAASVGPKLIGVVGRIFYGLGDAAITDWFGRFTDFNLLNSVTYIASAALGYGFMATGISGLLLIITILVLIGAFVMVAISYIRILVWIVMAPLQFALGAVPGKENLTVDYLKKLAAYTLSIPATVGSIFLGFFIATAIMTADIAATNQATNVWQGLGGTVSYLIMSIMAPAIMLFCFMSAFKMPKNVEGLLMGGDNKKR